MSCHVMPRQQLLTSSPSKGTEPRSVSRELSRMLKMPRDVSLVKNTSTLSVNSFGIPSSRVSPILLGWCDRCRLRSVLQDLFHRCRANGCCFVHSQNMTWQRGLNFVFASSRWCLGRNGADLGPDEVSCKFRVSTLRVFTVCAKHGRYPVNWFQSRLELSLGLWRTDKSGPVFVQLSSSIWWEISK